MGEQLSVEHVSKSFGSQSMALDDVSLDVEPGTFMVLLGPSGSGKTTLLRCIAGIERISVGRIEIGQVSVAMNGVHLPPERRDLSMVFQDYALWPHMSACDNVGFSLKRRGLGKQDRSARASEMLERVGLAFLADRFPSQLSGGEQQRVALARALVGETGIVLFDEPLSNLDADLRERMRIEIASLVRQVGATAVYITHDQAEAFALADVVGVLEHGHLVQFASPEVIYEAPVTPFVARFTGLAGELPVVIRGLSREGDVVEADAQTHSALRSVSARVGAGAGGHREGVLMIRPTAVKLCGVDEATTHLVGRVADVAFRGRGYEHAVELDCGTQLHSIFSPTKVARGQVVGLHLDQAGCHVFPSGASDMHDSAMNEEFHLSAEQLLSNTVVGQGV